VTEGCDFIRLYANKADETLERVMRAVPTTVLVVHVRGDGGVTIDGAINRGDDGFAVVGALETLKIWLVDRLNGRE